MPAWFQKLTIWIVVWATHLSGTPLSQTTLEQSSPVRLGLKTHLLLPSRLPDLEISVPTFGPHLNVPVGSDSLFFQALYGSRLSTHVSLFTLDYQFQNSTPFFDYQVFTGLHYLTHSVDLKKYNYIGANLGLGFTLPLASSFEMAVDMKIYLQFKPMITFGGGFSYLL